MAKRRQRQLSRPRGGGDAVSGYRAHLERYGGEALRAPVELGDRPPAKIKALLDNVDLLGAELQAYAYSLMRHVLVGVVVDYLTVVGARTVADEKAVGARTYMATYPAQNILGWRVERGPDGFRVSQLRLTETVTEPDGP